MRKDKPIILTKHKRLKDFLVNILKLVVIIYIFYYTFYKFLERIPQCYIYIIIFFIIVLLFGNILSFINKNQKIPNKILLKTEKALFILFNVYYKKYLINNNKFLFHSSSRKIVFTNKRIIKDRGFLGLFISYDSYFYIDNKIILNGKKNIFLEEENIEICSIQCEMIYNYLIKNKLINQTKS